jgi:DNA-binding transcriptional LysR family regulator
MPTSGSSDARARVPIAGRYKVTSSLAVRDALRAGFGLSLIPWIYVKEDIEQGRLRTVLNEWSAVDLSVYAVYPSRRHGVAKLRAFVDFLVEELNAGLTQSPITPAIGTGEQSHHR